jgi:hypothetical protein
MARDTNAMLLEIRRLETKYNELYTEFRKNQSDEQIIRKMNVMSVRLDSARKRYENRYSRAAEPKLHSYPKS